MIATTNWPSLSHAPIVEGLIDIRVERAGDANLAQWKNACDELAEEFPSRQECRLGTGQINLSRAAGASISTAMDEADGMILRSTDENWGRTVSTGWFHHVSLASLY